MNRKIRGYLVLTILGTLLLGACAKGGKQTTPGNSPQAGLQNECVRIANRNERERCLQEAQFGPGAVPQ